MRYLAVFFLVLFCVQARAQQITGQIVDINGVGIENAHVFYPESFKGTTTNSLGHFSLTQFPQLENVLITCIGYNDTIVPIESFVGGTIILRKREYQLEEISVISKRKEEFVVGCQKKNPNGVTFRLKGSENGVNGWYLYFNRKSNARVKSIGLHIEKSNSSNINLQFRVLAPDSLKSSVGKDLLLKDISVPLRTGWNFIDFSNENIRFTKYGLIVVFLLTGMEENDEVVISGTAKSPEYSWMSSLDYEKDFSLKLGNKKHKPAVQLVILE